MFKIVCVRACECVCVCVCVTSSLSKSIAWCSRPRNRRSTRTCRARSLFSIENAASHAPVALSPQYSPPLPPPLPSPFLLTTHHVLPARLLGRSRSTHTNTHARTHARRTLARTATHRHAHARTRTHTRARAFVHAGAQPGRHGGHARAAGKHAHTRARERPGRRLSACRITQRPSGTAWIRVTARAARGPWRVGDTELEKLSKCLQFDNVTARAARGP